jgi:hypothetical protein
MYARKCSMRSSKPSVMSYDALFSMTTMYAKTMRMLMSRESVYAMVLSLVRV